MNGKGSRRRKTAISSQEMADNWDRIFGKDKKANECKRFITAATEQLETAQRISRDSKIPVNLNDLVCRYLDSGWCYHPDSDEMHACPGIGKCDIVIKILD